MSQPTIDDFFEVHVRPFDPADANVLRELFAQSIEYLTADAYDEDQRLAWIAAAEDAQGFTDRLWKAETFVAECEAEQAGFASLKDAGSIDMLYVHPDFARQGAGTALVAALEEAARENGVAALTVDASDTAKPFFEALGFTAAQRNLVPREGLLLPNTTMTKALREAAGAGEEDTP